MWGTLIQTWRLHAFNPRPNNPTGRSEPGLNSKAFQLLQENKSVFLLNKSCSYGISFLYTCYLYKVTVNIAIYFLEYFQLSFFLLHLWNVGTTEEKYINGETPVKIITEFQLYKLKISSGQLLKQGNTTCKTSAACVDTYLWTFLQLKTKRIIMSKSSHTELLFLNFFSLVFQHLIQIWSPVFTIMGQWSQEQKIKYFKQTSIPLSTKVSAEQRHRHITTWI